VTPAERLAEDGWKKQTTYDEPRLSEMVAMYQEIGQEVHLEPFVPDENPGCSECMEILPDKYQTIYTRKKA